MGFDQVDHHLSPNQNHHLRENPLAVDRLMAYGNSELVIKKATLVGAHHLGLGLQSRPDALKKGSMQSPHSAA